MDSESEKIVQKTIDNLINNKSSISIAHRISTIKDSDSIFVIENGKVVENGNFSELMDKKKLFFALSQGNN